MKNTFAVLTISRGATSTMYVKVKGTADLGLLERVVWGSGGHMAP